MMARARGSSEIVESTHRADGSPNPSRRRPDDQAAHTQGDFADKAGIHRTYVSSIELGKVTVSIASAENPAFALETPLSAMSSARNESRVDWGPSERNSTFPSRLAAARDEVPADKIRSAQKSPLRTTAQTSAATPGDVAESAAQPLTIAIHVVGEAEGQHAPN